jgi:hypothetical protein
MARDDEPASTAARRHESRADPGRPRDMQTLFTTESGRRGTGTVARPLSALHRVGVQLPARWPRVAALTPSLCASVVLMLASLTACESVPSHAAATQTPPSPTQTLTPYPTPTASTPTALTPPPQDCPASQATRADLPGISPVMGSAPVWATTLWAPIHLTANDAYTRFGWTWKIIWEVGPSYKGSVAPHGVNLRDGTPLWFQFAADDPTTTTTTPLLDPRHPNHPVSVVGDDWVEWGSYVYLPAAGCYAIEASWPSQANWPSGSWRITFAAGL